MIQHIFVTLFVMFSMDRNATFYGLQKWAAAEFEKLGWMVLAHHYGMHEKVTTYIHSVQRLHRHLLNKIATIRDLDKKDDLAIIARRVEILLDHIMKDFS